MRVSLKKKKTPIRQIKHACGRSLYIGTDFNFQIYPPFEFQGSTAEEKMICFTCLLSNIPLPVLDGPISLAAMRQPSS